MVRARAGVCVCESHSVPKSFLFHVIFTNKQGAMAHSWVHCQRSYSWIGRTSRLIIVTYLQSFHGDETMSVFCLLVSLLSQLFFASQSVHHFRVCSSQLILTWLNQIPFFLVLYRYYSWPTINFSGILFYMPRKTWLMASDKSHFRHAS